MQLGQLEIIKIRVGAVALVALGLVLPTLFPRPCNGSQAIAAVPNDATHPAPSLGALGIPWADLNDRHLPPLSFRLPSTQLHAQAEPNTAAVSSAIPSLFDRRPPTSAGAWTFQIGVWVPYSGVLRGQDVTVNAGVGTTIDENGNLLGFGYYDGTPSGSPALDDMSRLTRPTTKK